MSVRNQVHFPFLTLLTLVLVVFVRPAEGFVYYDQREAMAPPTPRLQENPHQVVLDLRGTWELQRGEQDESQSAFIPGCFEGDAAPVVFRRSFYLADSLRPLHFQLHLPEISHSCEVRINGRLVASLTGFHLGFVCDLASDQLRFGTTNEIELRITHHLTPKGTFPVRRQLLQSQDYGGCFSGVYLRGVPSWSIEDARFMRESNSELSVISGTAQVRIAQYGPMKTTLDSSGRKSDVLVLVSVYDSMGQAVASGRNDVLRQGRANDYQAVITLPPFHANLWSPAQPHLYTLAATLIAGSDTLHRFERTFGFRTVEVREGALFLNGQPFYVRGVDFVPEYAIGRRVVSPTRLRQDLISIRDLGMNVIRVPSDPPPPLLLDLADELGLSVLVETGVDRIPGKLLEQASYRALVGQAVTQEIEAFQQHPCVLAWGLGTGLDWKNPATADFAGWLRQHVKQLDERPCYVELRNANAGSIPADFILMAWDSQSNRLNDLTTTVVPVIFSGIRRSAWSEGADERAFAGIVNQAEFLTRSVLAVEDRTDVDGFLIHSLSDYYGSSPLLGQPAADDPHLYAFGLVDWNRQERLAYAKLRDLVRTGQASPPVPISSTTAPPLVFPVAGLIAIFALSIELRRNNVFRQNLKRTFLHAHGFCSDLRHRRFLHPGQPLLLWALESVSLGLLMAAGLYSLKDNLALDYALTHFLTGAHIKAWVIELILDPVRLLLYCSVLFALLIVLKAMLIRFVSAILRSRVDTRQAWNYVVWSFAAVLFLLPVSVVFHRAVQIPTISTAVLIAVVAGIVWGGLRLMSTLCEGFGTTRLRVYAVVMVLAGALTAIALAVLENRLGTLTYFQYFYSTFMAG
ncbi:hypothetical protein KKH27_08560 [bacterium]|nr:hypothetical protein [bacterium]MBU1984921.1 hypothetical protein [bacterium]